MARVQLSGIKASYTRMGDWEGGKSPVVLVHGLAASSAFWMHAADTLSHSHPVLLYDLRGHGRTTLTPTGYSPAALADDLLELLDVLSIRDAVVAGHSFGGSVVLNAAVSRPSALRAIVLADTRLRMFQPTLTPKGWARWQENREELSKFGFSIDEGEDEGGFRMLTELARLELRPEGAAEAPRWVHEFFGLRQSKFTAARWMELVETTSLADEVRDESRLTESALRDLAVPVLGIYGENSPVAASGQRIRDLCPGWTIRVVPGAGHFFPATRPNSFVEPVLELLGSSPGDTEVRQP